MNRPGSARANTGGIARPPSSQATRGANVGAGNSLRPASGRPTGSALGGIAPQTAGGGSISSMPERNAFSVQIRNKTMEINTEIERLLQEMEERRDDNNKVQNLKKKIEDTTDQLNNLHNKLTDTNAVNELAKQKVYVGGFSSKDVQDYLKRREDESALIVVKSQRAKETMDDIFTKRERIDGDAEELEHQITQKESQFEEIVRRLPSKQQEEYRSLQRDKVALEEQRAQLIHQVEGSKQQLQKAESSLASDPARRHALQLRQKSTELRNHLEQLDIQLVTAQEAETSASLTILDTDSKEIIMNKMRESQSKIKEYENISSEADDQIIDIQGKLTQLEESERAAESKAENEQQYKQLLAKEVELDRMLASFASAQEQGEEKKRNTQEMIERLLLHIAEGLRSSNTVLTPQQMRQLEEDLDFKRQQTENAQNTNDKLTKELSRLKEDLAKMGELEHNIETELNELSEKQRIASEEVKTFSALDALRSGFQQKESDLKKEETRLSAKIDGMRNAVKELNEVAIRGAEEAKKDKGYSQLESMEKKLKNVYKVVYEMQQSVIISQRESSYEKVHGECSALLTQINTMHITTATQSQTSITTSAAMEKTASN
ncbi:MAG: putative intraflagellar transport protein 74 [Streblomastix strix]|uniref:Putative intraflagellar transport protein 74 n=1 Tax=Streblomastix strix TaxID=222440 RepID=A0A5J4VGI9_9EUKA|nr:MAG: putative intraflagellar transport protein 74 [Streblomastix strix]